MSDVALQYPDDVQSQSCVITEIPNKILKSTSSKWSCWRLVSVFNDVVLSAWVLLPHDGHMMFTVQIDNRANNSKVVVTCCIVTMLCWCDAGRLGERLQVIGQYFKAPRNAQSRP